MLILEAGKQGADLAQGSAKLKEAMASSRCSANARGEEKTRRRRRRRRRGRDQKGKQNPRGRKDPDSLCCPDAKLLDMERPFVGDFVGDFVPRT
jgi:hypothetical protein